MFSLYNLLELQDYRSLPSRYRYFYLELSKMVYLIKYILISTIAAVVTASVALLLMNFSKSGKTVDESRAWLKRIVITWAILNGLGFIMAYITPFFAGGQWNG